MATRTAHLTLLGIGLFLALSAGGCGPALTAAGVLGVAALRGSRSDSPDNPPAVSVTTPTGAVNDTVAITYRLTDANPGDRADVTVEYSRDSGGTFTSATQAFVEGAEGTTNLTTDDTGVDHTFFWNTAEDLGSLNVTGVQVRVSARAAGADADERTDTATTGSFDVLNRFMTSLATQASALEILPTALTLNSAGDLFLTDASGHRVLRVDRSTGASTVLAGTGTAGFQEGNLTATQAQLNIPLGIGVDPQGDVLIADFLNTSLRRIETSNGFLRVLGGKGGSLEEGKLAVESFFLPRDLALDSQGNAYILTEDGKVRVVNLAGTGSLSYTFGTTTCTTLPGSSISVASEQIHSLIGGDPGCGSGDSAYTQRLSQPRALALEETGGERVAYTIDLGGFGSGGMGNAPFLVAANLGTTSVTRFSLRTNSTVTIPAGDGAVLVDGSVLKNLGNNPDLAVGAGGVLLVSSVDANRVTALNVQVQTVQVAAQSLPPGTFQVVLGTGTFGLEGDGLLGPDAELVAPTAVAGDAQGNVYVGEASGRIRVVAGSSGLSFAGQNVAPGRVSTIPAAVPNTSPAVVSPIFIAQDRSGDLFFTDSSLSDPRSNRVLRLNQQTGAVSAVFGSGLLGDSGDGGPAQEARAGQLGSPALSPDRRVLCVPDLTHHRVRAVNLTQGSLTFLGVDIAAGHVETVIGVGRVTSGTAIPLGEGGAASAASLHEPTVLDFDDRGLLWVSDSGNNRIRVANPTGSPQTLLGVTIAPDQIQTLVGTGSAAGSENAGEGGPAGLSDLTNPAGFIGVDGHLYLAEESLSGEDRIRVVNLGSATIQRGAVSVAPGAIATVAGSGVPRALDNSNLGDGGSALATSFRSVTGFTVSESGLLYVSDRDDSRVRVVNLGASQTLLGFTLAPGVVETAVGNGVPAFAGDPGTVGSTFNNLLSASPVDEPHGLLSFPDGRLIVLDANNGALRLANFGSGPRSLAGASANPGQLVIVAGERSGKVRAVNPQDVRVNAQGAVFFSDSGKSGGEPAVLRLDPQTRVVTRLAGNGDRTAQDDSNLGDGGPALAATFGEVQGIDLDAQGNLYVCDPQSERIRFVNTTSTSQSPLNGTTVAPGNIASILDGSLGDNNANNDEGQPLATGQVDLFSPVSVAAVPGALWVVDEGSSRLLRIDTGTASVAGVFSRTVLGTGSGTFQAASGNTVLNDPTANFTALGVEVGDVVRLGTFEPRVTSVLSATVLALGTPPPGSPTVVAYSIQRDDRPLAVAAASSSVAYLALQSVQRSGGRLLKLTRTGSTFAIQTLAGNGNPAWNGDLIAATSLQFGEVRGMYLSRDLLYLADATTHRIIVINTGTTTQTVADLSVGPGEARTLAGGGQGQPGFNGDAIPPHLALLNRPTGVALGPRDEVVLVDTGNARVRRFER